MDAPFSQTVDIASGEAIVGLLAGVLGKMGGDVATVAFTAARFAKPVTDEQIIDVEALTSALLAVDGRLHIEAGLFQAWSLQHQRLRALRQQPDSKGLKPRLSRSVLGVVLPRAMALRDETGASTPVQLRHLLFALVEQPTDKWPRSRPTDAEVAELRSLLIDLFRERPLPGERIDVWERIAGMQAPPPPPPLAERTPLLSDSPAAVDELGRKPLADALAARLVRLQRDEAGSAAPKAVMVHLHGPWGSGKSSLVHFLSETLAAQQPPWLVVDFNAWRNARVKPPWWNMLTEFKRALDRRLPWWRRRWLDLRWAWVSPSVDNVVLLAVGVALLGFVAFFGSRITSTVTVWKDLLGAAGVIAGAIAGGRALMLGGNNVAKSFDALRTDSFRPFITLFDMLVKECPCPVLIVLDDLDRCDAETVTDLLEGIQTLFRGAPVVFLAVADRYWITASFAQRFSLFESGGDKARPVGDLFLDKMFQVSVSIPALPVAVKRAYLGRLLGTDMAAPPEAILPETAIRHEEIQAAIDSAPEDQRPALRAQAVARLASEAADKQVEHRLLRWVGYIEPNPRGMKRLVNAIGMVQARSLLEGRSVDFDTIVLWTILELRWPRAAAAIAADPGLIDADGSGPDALLAAWGDALFQKIANELDASRVRALIGAVDEDDGPDA